MFRPKVVYVGLLLILLFVGAPLALGQDGEQVAPPRVIDTVPLPGEELDLHGSVTFTFDRPMDAENYELTLEPALEGGSSSWDEDDKLTYTPPAEGFARGTEYVFSLMANSADGQPMAEPFSLRLATVGYIEVADVLPAPDSGDIEVQSAITVIFNQPIVPLVSINAQEDLPDPIRITPETPGVGEWLNTSIYIFTPQEVLLGGTDYTVAVPAGLEAVNGAVLAEDYQFGFRTADPVVVGMTPGDGSDGIPLNVGVTVTFSQPIDPATQNGIRLEGPSGVIPLLQYEWSADNSYVTARPSELLLLNGLYDIVVDSSIIRTTAGAALDADYSQSFRTVPYPRILYTDPANGEQEASPFGGLRIYFSAPINEDTLEGKFTVSPEPWREYETYYYSYDNSFALYFDSEPSTEYTITIAPGIADPYGNEIAEGAVIRYTTAPYGPEVTLNVPDFAGLYNAYNPSTQLFVTHRNVSSLNFELYDISLNEFARLAGPGGYQYRLEYAPSLDELIRAWTVPVSTPLNQRRYNLTLLSERGPGGVENIQCVGASSTQLVVGAQARVTLGDPRPSRVRSDPNLSGEILVSYEPGTEFEIRGGPICADGYLWWQIFNPTDGLQGWMAEGSGDAYFIEPTSLPAVTPDAADLEPLSPGIYYLRVSGLETSQLGYDTQRHAMIVATANITMKFTPKHTLAWVTDMQSGLPIVGIPVTFYDGGFNPLANGTTDENGLVMVENPFRFESLYTTLFAVVETGDHFGFVASDFSQGLDPWYFNIFGDYQPALYTGYLYTDRPIYRPDQPVYFRGIVRNRDDVVFTPIQGLDTILVTVYDDESQVLYEFDAPLTPYGTFSGQFDLDAEAGLGYYRITARLPDALTEDNYVDFSIGFSVAEYRAPEFQVTTTPAADAVAQGETIQVNVESRYFFGAPVSNARVNWAVISDNYFFNYTGDGYWQFIDYNYDTGFSAYYDTNRESIANGEGMTDDQGRFLIEMPADLGEKTQSQVYTLEATVTDESDLFVAGRTQVIVHQGHIYVGISPDEYVSTAGQESGFQLLSVDWDSQPVASQEVEYRVVERRWSSVQEEDETGRTVWSYEVEEIEVATGSVTTDSQGLAHVAFTPPNGGVFKIYAIAHDSAGNRINSSAFMWVSSEEYVSWRQQNSNRIDLISNADEYSVGDTAEILIASPFQGNTRALVTVERGDIIKTEVIEMASNSYIYRLPIEDFYAPNVFVSVILVKGVDENTPYTQFRAGLIQLNVETNRLALNVEVTPDIPEGVTPGPGDPLTLNVRTTDWEGNPVSAEVGIGVTDLAVLSIAPPNSGPLMEQFYGLRGVSVRTSTALTVSVDQVTQTIIDTIKGGGGGGGEEGIFEVRQDFVDTPLWEPAVVTDENGVAQVTVTLPDNLTTWRIDARAITTGLDGPMLVGEDTTDFISTKPLLIRPITPRFMVVGDVLTLAAIVNNNTTQEQNVEVTMQGTGFNVLDNIPLTQTATIPPGGRVRIDWKVEALDVLAVDVFFGVQNEDGSLQDASKPPLGQGDEQLLPVYRYVVPETVGTSGVLEGPGAISYTEVIALPERIDATQGTLDIRVDRSLAGPALDGLEYLRNYPHQCIEQTVSRFLPNVITMRALALLNQSNPELERNLATEVNFGLQRLYAQQKVDGGWGWFPTDESNPLTTAYALIGLVEAGNSGFAVAPEVIQAAVGFLNGYVLDTERGMQLGTAEGWVLNRQAFVLYALAVADQGNASRLSNLFDLRDRLNLDAKAYLAMSMLRLNPADARLETLMSDFANAAVLSATGTHWEDRPDWYNWTTDTRTTALILMAMAQHDSSNRLLPGAVRWIMVARKADAWETTQETAWAVMSLTEWMLATGELDANYDFNIRLNADLLEIEDNTANAENVKEHEVLRVEVSELLRDEANRLTLIKDEGPGNLYYTAHLETYQEVGSVEPAARGIIINRMYYLAGDAERKPITSAKVGEEVVVELTIIAPRNLHYAVIEDPFPAGAEAINPNLLTESILTSPPRLERGDPFGRGWGWWWFSRTEFRDEKAVMYATYLPRGTYTYSYRLRMGLAGEYNVIPTTGQEFYFPEVYGRGAGLVFTIQPADEVAVIAQE